MEIYAVTFNRQNFYFTPSLKEEVVVLVELDIPYDLEEFEDACWKALWSQYPLWSCPYSQSNAPKSRFEHLRHSFCSPSMKEVRLLSMFNNV